MNRAVHYWQSPYIAWTREIPSGYCLLVCTLRTARQKAKVAAIAEVLALLSHFEAKASLTGPLADEKRVCWIALPSAKLNDALPLFHLLGYTVAVDLVKSAAEVSSADGNAPTDSTIRWRGEYARLTRLYQENPGDIREQAPDRRDFLLPAPQGKIVKVKGYRGDGSPLGRRGLPVCDARLLVNLALGGEGHQRLLDPFAGTGGVIIEASRHRWTTISMDIDPVVSYGLTNLADWHCVGDAATLPFSEAAFDAIATEPPYHADTQALLPEALREMHRVLKPSGRITLLCADWQEAIFMEASVLLEMKTVLSIPINRKGSDVHVLVLQKSL